MIDGKREQAAPVVLIIDDDKGLRTVLQTMLEDEGFEVMTAEDGDEGIAIVLVADNRIDLVVTDIQMPGKAGNETIHEIRKVRPGIGIIAMSGGGRTGNFDFLNIAKKQGVDAVLHKPFDLGEFADLARRLASGREKKNDAPGAAAAKGPTAGGEGGKT